MNLCILARVLAVVFSEKCVSACIYYEGQNGALKNCIGGLCTYYYIIHQGEEEMTGLVAMMRCFCFKHNFLGCSANRPDT